MCSTKNFATAAIFFVVVAISSCVDLNDWDPTIRDKTEMCSTLSQYSPNGEAYCQQFELCCASQFDPNNGDKCQIKESECTPNDVGNSATGTCKFLNCTELVTTTTTTTTPAPVYESINGVSSAFAVGSSLLLTIYALF